jgi:OPA family glycerol-3-phosphate transporter-like MFS transporter
MIQGGRQLAFVASPFILSLLPWQWCFWIPAAILAVMFVANLRWVADTPQHAGFEFSTGDETKEEAGQPTTFLFVLKKVFASQAMWLIAFASMCIGMVRNGIDEWWSRYVRYAFSVPPEHLHAYGPYELAAWGMPFAAILGGLAAGTSSDRVFGSRRAPVIFFAFLGMAASLGLLRAAFDSAWLGCLMLVVISFFIQSAHSLVGGAASMDFGGKKAVATAAGLFDGAQYLAGAIMGAGMGALIDHYKTAGNMAAGYRVWPLAPIPFALLGALLISRLWNVVPGRRK